MGNKKYFDFFFRSVDFFFAKMARYGVASANIIFDIQTKQPIPKAPSGAGLH